MRPLEKRDFLIIKLHKGMIPTQWALPNMYIPTLGSKRASSWAPRKARSPLAGGAVGGGGSH